MLLGWLVQSPVSGSIWAWGGRSPTEPFLRQVSRSVDCCILRLLWGHEADSSFEALDSHLELASPRQRYEHWGSGPWLSAFSTSY